MMCGISDAAAHRRHPSPHLFVQRVVTSFKPLAALVAPIILIAQPGAAGAPLGPTLSDVGVIFGTTNGLRMSKSAKPRLLGVVAKVHPGAGKGADGLGRNMLRSSTYSEIHASQHYAQSKHHMKKHTQLPNRPPPPPNPSITLSVHALFFALVDPTVSSHCHPCPCHCHPCQEWLARPPGPRPLPPLPLPFQPFFPLPSK